MGEAALQQLFRERRQTFVWQISKTAKGHILTTSYNGNDYTDTLKIATPARTILMNLHELDVSTTLTVRVFLSLCKTLMCSQLQRGLSTRSQQGSTDSQILMLLDGTSIAGL